MDQSKTRFFTRWLAALLSLSLSGCSLVQPYNWNSSFIPTEVDKADINSAVSFAEKLRQEYQQAANTQASLSILSGPALFPLGASAAALAATGTVGNPITALTMAGTTGYATASWLRSPPREQAYRLGAQALTCVINAAIPLRSIDAAQARRLKEVIGLDAGDHSQSLPALIARARSLVEQVRVNAGQAIQNNATRAADWVKEQAEAREKARNGAPAVAQVEAQDEAHAKDMRDQANTRPNLILQSLAAISQALSDADASYRSGIDLHQRLSQEGQSIIGNVLAVQDSVNGIVSQTIPDLSSLSGALDQIKAAAAPPAAPAAAPASVPKTAGVSGVADGGPDDLESGVTVLNKVMDSIRTATLDIQIAVDQVRARSQGQSLAVCTLDRSGVKGLISVAPSRIDIAVDSTRDQKWTVVLDGRAPFWSTPYGSALPADLTVSSPQQAGGSFTLEVVAKKTLTAPARDTEYTEQIRDATGNTTVLTLVVKGK